MSFRAVVDSMVRTPTQGYTHFWLGRPAGDGADRFVPDETYVEIRLTQMHLRDERVLWRDFIPLGSILTEFQFAAGRQVVPFVVGPDLLAGAANRDQGDMVEFFGRRVAGPFPYRGDDLVLFASLSRLETGNWAKRALSLLGTVASAFDVSKLSTYVNVAGALTGALQGLLEMREVEQRVGVDVSFTTPPADPAVTSDGSLRPGYAVFMNSDSREFPKERIARFSVEESRLREDGHEFRDVDFMVLELAALRTRADYGTFPFHRVYWREAEKRAMEGSPQDAWSQFTLLATDLIQSDDLVPSHRDALLGEYGDKLEALIARREMIFTRGGRQRFDEAQPAPLDEPQLEEAVRRRSGEPGRSLESVLEMVGQRFSAT